MNWKSIKLKINLDKMIDVEDRQMRSNMLISGDTEEKEKVI